MSRTPDQRIYSSGSYDIYSFAQCYVSLGAPDSADFAFAKCDAGWQLRSSPDIPVGNFKITVFDQWNDLLRRRPVHADQGDGQIGGTPSSRWKSPSRSGGRISHGRIFIDQNEDGVSQPRRAGPAAGAVQHPLPRRQLHGFNNTDLAGYAGFNEVFPFLNWLVVDIDSARHKLTGIHVAL